MKSTMKKKSQIAIILSLIAALLAATGALAAAGDLDTTFDSDGLVTTIFGAETDVASDIAIQSNGKIVVAGYTTTGGNHDIAVARYNSNGSLDTSFDTDGKVSTDVNNQDSGISVVIQNDGKVIVAGRTTPSGDDSEFALLRYNSNGSLDTTFDTDGKVVTNLGSGDDPLGKVALQTDGKIVVVGSKYIGVNNYDIAVVRYNTNGTLDTSFDTDGIVTTAIGSNTEWGVSLVIQTDGKIIIGGTAAIGSYMDFALVRYNSNGSLDTSFDTDGIVTTDFNGLTEDGGHIAIQPNGKILIAGYYTDVSGGLLAVARYNSDGSLDTSFDTDGKVTALFGPPSGIAVQDITLQSNGKIVLTGFTSNASSNLDFALARLNSDGSLDTGFGSGGKISTDFGANYDDVAISAAIQTDGNIVVAGGRNNIVSYDFALARYIGDPTGITVTTSADNTTPDGFCSLREAITNINNNAATYTDCAPGTGTDSITFAANYTITLGSQLPAITSTIVINGNGAANTVIQANAAANTATYRVFRVGSAGNLTLDGLTVRNGYCTGSCDGFSDNGGGIENNGILTITNSAISGNAATFNGGGIFNIGIQLTVTNSTFSGNTAAGVTGVGGGIYNTASLDVTNSTFWNNTSTGVGGGGIHNSSTGGLAVKNSTFSGNTAPAGGGGGIYNANGSLGLRNTILANSAGGANDCYNYGFDTIGDNVNNLIFNNAATGNKCGTPAVTTDPMLLTSAPQDNGGPTQTFAIGVSSPAHNAGDNTTCNAAPVSGLDQRGVTRPQGAQCDIGSYEFVTVPLIVTKIADTNDGVCDADCSLREAISMANGATGPDTIQFADALGTITLGSGLPAISDIAGLTIDGGSDITVSGNNLYQVFYVNTSVPLTLDSLTVTNGRADDGFGGGDGGAIYNTGTVTIEDSAFYGNSAVHSGGGIQNFNGTLSVKNSTFAGNTAVSGGGIRNNGTLTVTNSTFSGNSATALAGGGIYGATGTLTIRNSTLSGNSASPSAGGGIYNEAPSTLNLANTIIANSPSGGDCFNFDITATIFNNLVENGACSASLSGDPSLGVLANYGGSTQTFPLLPGSTAIDAGNDTVCTAAPVSNLDQRGIARPGGAHCDIGAFEFVSATINVTIGGATQGSYVLAPSGSLRVNYTGLDSGPVRVASTNAIPIISAIREAWAVNGVTTSFSQLMGLPLGQVSDKYVFPGYNNVTLNEQLRIGNVDTVPSTVTVTIGGVLRGTYILQPNEAVRVNYAGLDSGPVIVDGTNGVDIISAIREAWAVNGTTTSFVQLMGLPATQLSDKYVFPAYNNVTLNEQLRIGNVDTVPSTVTVTIGGVLRGTYILQPDEAVRVNYAGLDSGPVVVQGTLGVNIISAIRDAWAVNGTTTSFAQLMGMPATQLSDQYVFPAYNNVTLNDQLRIGNVDIVPSTVTVTIGGVLRGTYTLQANEAVRVNYAGLDSGPVIVDGTNGVSIISAIREAWAVNGTTQSFVQLIGLPFGQLSRTYLFPGYNNVTLNEQLRISVP